MINVSIVKLLPSLLLEEDEEEEHTECNHDDVQRLAKYAEPDRPLEVYAEGNHDTVGNECPMHPTEAIGKAYGYPCDEPE